jgi:hypothetical protein
MLSLGRAEPHRGGILNIAAEQEKLKWHHLIFFDERKEGRSW